MTAYYSALELDELLTAQFAVAWAGEGGGDPPRLGWWPTDMISDNGGHDLFQRLLPQTWAWAALQVVREAARRCDAEMRARAVDADDMITLFHLGVELDERLGERLLEHKRSGKAPSDALPGLKSILWDTWDRERFAEWLSYHGEPRHEAAALGRLLSGAPAPTPDRLAAALLAALQPLPDAGKPYPLPHYRRGLA